MIQFREIIIAAFEAMASEKALAHRSGMDSRKSSVVKIMHAEDTERLRLLTLNKMNGTLTRQVYPYRCKLIDPKL